MKTNDDRERRRWCRQIDFNMAFAATVMEKRGEVSQMFILHAGRKQFILMPEGIELPEAEGKQVFYALVSISALAHRAEAITSISEAWMRNIDQRAGESEAEVRQRANDVPPSEAPDRSEALVCTALWRSPEGVKSLFSMRGILRDEQGGFAGLGPASDYGEMNDGRMADLLPPEMPSPDEAALARRTLENLGVALQQMPQRH